MAHASVSPAVSERAAQVRLMIFDVDGVLTDGRLYFGAEGESLKAFDTLDGQGLKLLAASGVQLALITGRRSQIVAARAQELGIAWVYQGVRDKAVAFAELLSQAHYTAEQCGYMGDDWPDLPVMLKVAFAAAPANAHAEVLARAHWVARAQGGAGAVREACDLILQAQQSYAKLLLTACGQA